MKHIVTVRATNDTLFPLLVRCKCGYTTGADNWEKRSYLPIYDDAPWFEDGKPATLPGDFYSSRFLVDKLSEYIASGADDACGTGGGVARGDAGRRTRAAVTPTSAPARSAPRRSWPARRP